MNVKDLVPVPDKRENFRRDRERFVPERSGCYALATFEGLVLYVGKSINLRQRFGNHLDDPQKVSKTRCGTAFFFYWRECDDLETEKIERTWQNECELHDGSLPILNKLRSPIPM